MHPFEAYLKELRDIHATGAAVKETSYYPALAGLLNEIGKHLTPKVRCVSILANQGQGSPDGGLFTKDQFGKTSDLEPKAGQKPARGAMEVKGWADDLDRINLRRALSPDEARHITATARRLAALRLMQSALDRHYQSSKS